MLGNNTPKMVRYPPFGTYFHTGTSVRYPILQHIARYENQKNPRAHKNKIGTSPPPPQKTQNNPPPPLKTRNFMDMAFPAERTHFSRCP